MVQNKKKRRAKYGNKKVKTADHTYDSKREKLCHDLIKKFKIPHKFQVKYELQPGFRNPSGKAIRKIYMVIDFVLVRSDGTMLIVDVKGVVSDMSAMKYKMLGYRLNNAGHKYEIIFLKSDRAVKDFVLKLHVDGL